MSIIILLSTPRLHVGMGALYLVAGADAAGTADAPVVVQSVSFMGQVYCGEVRAAIFETRVVHSKFSASGTQLAAAVCHTNGTDMIPLGKQEFKKHLAVLLEFFRMGLDHHSILGLGCTCRHEPSGALHLYQAEPASTNGGQSFQVTKCRQIDSVLAASLKERCTGRSAYILTIYIQSDD
jgi:hypothetical protein